MLLFLYLEVNITIHQVGTRDYFCDKNHLCHSKI